MDVLALTHRVPFPPDRGDRIRSFNLLSRLGQEHRLWLCAIDDAEESQEVQDALESFCHRHAVFALSPWRRAVGALASLVKREPVTLGYFHHPDVTRTIDRWQTEVKFDAAYVFSSSMAPYWLDLHARTGLPGVMDFIDVDSEKWGQYARHERTPKRWIYSREQRELAKYERHILQHAHKCLFVSEAEVRTFATIGPELPTYAMANGVDGEFFAMPQLARRGVPPRLVFTGQMDYGANIDAVTFFVEKILPLVRQTRPDVVFDIVGSRPTPKVRALANVKGVRVTGWVKDVRPYLWDASVAVVPLRIAQGTQNKVLEAMAASLPVVATSMAVRGIANAGGDHLQVADEPQEFAQAILRLVDDPAFAEQQSQRAVSMVNEHHSWDAAARALSDILEESRGSTAVPT